MPIFTLKSFPQILTDMVSVVGANSPLTDINSGSVILTMLECAATEDANTYIQMLNIIRSFSLDTTTGTDLDDRAYEYGLIRYTSTIANGKVTFTDTAFSKIWSPIYTGLNGPSTGSTSVYIFDASDFPNGIAGNVIIGRGTGNEEVLPYAPGGVVNVGAYWRIDFTASCTKDHGTDETVVLSQGGIRVIPAGTTCTVPESDANNEVVFTLQSNATILDGENEIADCVVVSQQSGTIGNVGSGAIRKTNASPTTVTVTNPVAFTNGRDLETDADLRERIRDTIQSLSKGTIISILTAVNAVSSDTQNNRVVSSSFEEATTLNEISHCYIDDGVGLEPWFEGVASDVLMESALGSEKFLKINPERTPVTKAHMVTANEEPYGLVGGEILYVLVKEDVQMVTFDSSLFAAPGAVTAEEVVRQINDQMPLVEARTTNDRTKVVIEPTIDIAESIMVTGGTANVFLGFKENVRYYTLNAYKNDVPMYKDGENAYTISLIPVPGGGYVGLNGTTLVFVIDGKTTASQTVTFGFQTTIVDVVAFINAHLVGATATILTRTGGQYIVVTSDNDVPGDSAVQITGASTADTILGFTDHTAVWGHAKDYTFNRANGQMELVTSLALGDNVSIGSAYTRPYLTTTAAGTGVSHDNFNAVGGDTLILQVDDIVNSTVTTGAIDVSNFRDSALFDPAQYNILTADHFVGEYVRFTDTTGTVALRGLSRLITAYNPVNGQVTTAAFPAIPQNADTYEIVQIITIPGGVAVSYTPTQAQAILAPLGKGFSFYGKVLGLNTYLRIQSNSQHDEAAIRVHSASTVIGAAKFTFPTDTTSTAQVSNFGYIESANEGPYTLGKDQNLTFVVDEDPTYRTFDITMQVAGTVTTDVDASNFRDLNLTIGYTTTDMFEDAICRFSDTTPTIALRSLSRTVSAYNKTTGQLTTSAFPVAPAIGDLFDIIPITTKNVVDFMNTPAFTSLSQYCEIHQSTDGDKVQISTLTPGAAGAIQCTGGTANNFVIPLLTNGTALGQTTIGTIVGLSKGLPLVIDDNGAVGPADITITDIVGAAAPYTVTVSVDAGGTDISTYLVTNTAHFQSRNVFDFDNIANTGRDGYSYNTGLIQEAQWTVDGKATDLTNYPGVKAAGVRIDVKAPVIQYTRVEVDVTSAPGVALSAVKNEVKAAISQYINTLGVGEDVISSEIITKVMEVDGVIDVVLIAPTTQTVQIAPNEKVLIMSSDIIIG